MAPMKFSVRKSATITFGFIILCLVSFIIYLTQHQWLNASWPLCTAAWVFNAWWSDRQYRLLKVTTDELLELTQKFKARGDALYAVLCELGPEVPPGIVN